MDDFSQRFVIVYERFAEQAKAKGQQSSKLAFARFTGASRGSMQAWEKGQLPSAKHLLLMHDQLGFAMRWLITGEGEMFDGEVFRNEVEALRARVAELEAEVRETDRVNRQLTARLLVEGATDQPAAPDTGKAADGQR